MPDPAGGGAPPSHDQFARLVELHQASLHAYLAGLVGQAEQAFDLVQETFYDAWVAARRGSSPFATEAPADDDAVRRWLFRAASNNALSALRRRRLIRWEPLEGLERDLLCGDERGGFEEAVAEREAMRAALDALTPQDVACLLLRIVHGFSAAEAGLILGTSADNVNNRLARAKQRLRAAYARHERQTREAPTP